MVGLERKIDKSGFCMQAVFGREAKRKMIIEFLWWFRYFFLEMSGTWMRIYCPMTSETRMNYFWDFVRSLIVPQVEWVFLSNRIPSDCCNSTPLERLSVRKFSSFLGSLATELLSLSAVKSIKKWFGCHVKLVERELEPFDNANCVCNEC